ncbi:hypothetical protein [Aureimonas ureilytica]|uniref:hypothetical protein n=1 Tax=Aureimonas ureilytica TaxID=401562 RepID=UPI00036BE77E|nr:hypothetical protein [Aureimonas ureilytica]
MPDQDEKARLHVECGAPSISTIVSLNASLPHEDRREGDYIQTFTGRRFWPLDPRADDVCIEDIAHSLSMQCRYAGHCKRFYSVAEHCVLMAHRVTAPNKLWALLHDASEAYLVDVPRPIKSYLENYQEAESDVMLAICMRFGLSPTMPAEVHEADSRIISDELVNMEKMAWHGRHDDPLGVTLRYWAPEVAKAEFMSMYERLTAGLASRPLLGGRA